MYEVIYADPPWSYASTMLVSGKIKNASDAYPTMSEKDLFAFPIDDFAADNCMLFMWTSNPHLEGAIKLGNHLGFKYCTVGFVWNKNHVTPGFYTMSQCELCLVFKRGKIPQPRGIRNAKQLHSETRTVHSRKPSHFRDQITEMFPTQKKIELFARNTSTGWDVYGNETTKYDLD